jgi:hypothetical protein
MKKIYIIILFALFACMACQREEEDDQRIIPCNLQTEWVKDTVEMTVWLVATLPERDYSTSFLLVNESAVLMIREKGMTIFNEICNYPQYARDWDISSSRIEVILSARMHLPSKDHGIQPSIILFYDMELTSLKRK